MTDLTKMPGTTWINGEWIDNREAKVHVLSHGLHYASSVFEGERAYDGNIFLESEHHERLRYSAEQLEFEVPYSVEELNNVARELLERNNFTNAYVRPVAFRGGESLNVSHRLCETHVAMMTFDWPAIAGELRAEGLKMKTVSKYARPPEGCVPTQAKAAGHYTVSSAVKAAAEREGYHDGLVLDYRGYVADSSTANVFMVFDGEIHTPITDCCFNGLTRKTTIPLAQQLGYKVVERHITPEEIKKADEVFLTGTAVEVIGVGQIDDIKYKVGPITKELETAFQDLVRGKFKLNTAA